MLYYSQHLAEAVIVFLFLKSIYLLGTYIVVSE